jgi:serine kinase of HPr protein (carbohydrate metabolism regulator)
LAGTRAVLIRGPSGAGKSRLALALIEAARAGLLPFTRLVADDRVHLLPAAGRLLVRPATALAGLVEMRGVGIVRVAYEPCAVVGIVVDLGASAERLPEAEQRRTVIEGITLPRLAVAAGEDALPPLVAHLTCSLEAVRMPHDTVLGN